MRTMLYSQDIGWELTHYSWLMGTGLVTIFTTPLNSPISVGGKLVWKQLTCDTLLFLVEVNLMWVQDPLIFS